MTDNVTIVLNYPKMDPEVKVKWLEALRSGKFRQGEGFLKTADGCNCCLGVLAEINNVPAEQSKEELDNGAFVYSFPYVGFPDEPYTDVHQTPVGYCGIAKAPRNDLMNMNDDGMTFPEIADFIEKNL